MKELLQPALAVLSPVLVDADAKKQLVAAKCLGLLRGYAAMWADSPYLIESVEDVLTSDLYNPRTERKSRSFTIAGKLDVRAVEIGTGARVLFDHKTTSENITDPNAPYWRILAVDSQLSQYMLLEWLRGNKLEFGVWDVVKKPMISPRLVAKADLKAVLESGVYCGEALADADRDALAIEPRETMMMYAARVTQECTTEKPEAYFQRRKVPRLNGEVLEYADELWGHAQDILLARRDQRWPRNAGGCFTYNSPCMYLGICSGHDSPESENWKQRAWVHPELPILNDTRGVEILTNSRVRTFQTCRRKHQLRYEIGLERVEEEEREALFFGDLFHRVLEQYFLALRNYQQKGTYL